MREYTAAVKAFLAEDCPHDLLLSVSFSFFNFFMLANAMHKRGICYRNLFVRLSLRPFCHHAILCLNISAEHIVEYLSPPGPNILVF